MEAMSPEVHPNSPSDVQQKLVIKEEAPEEQSPGGDQQDPELLHIKEKEEDFWSLEDEELRMEEETDPSMLPLNVVLVKSEDEEDKPLFSQLQQHQPEAGDSPTSSTADLMKAGTDEEEGGTGASSRHPDLNPDGGPSCSSETDVSHDDVKRPSESGSETEDSETEWTGIRAPESGGSSCSGCGQQFNRCSPHRHGTCPSTTSSTGCWVSQRPDGEKKSVTSLKVQPDVKCFTCDDCGKSFNWKNNINVHMRIHSGEKPFGCDVCGRRFSQKSHLNIHTRIHTGEKPFGCSVCGQRFSDKSHLNKHMRIHTGDKPLACEHCRQRFSDKTSLNRHMRIHTGDKPFGCEACGQRFSDKSTLKKHIRIHTGEKPFVCYTCGKKFSLKGSLKTHLRIHTGEKPFGCVVCGQRFRQLSNLNAHTRIHQERSPSAVPYVEKHYPNVPF